MWPRGDPCGRVKDLREVYLHFKCTKLSLIGNFWCNFVEIVHLLLYLLLIFFTQYDPYWTMISVRFL